MSLDAISGVSYGNKQPIQAIDAHKSVHKGVKTEDIFGAAKKFIQGGENTPAQNPTAFSANASVFNGNLQTPQVQGENFTATA